jgi:hypothetical protein
MCDDSNDRFFGKTRPSDKVYDRLEVTISCSKILVFVLEIDYQ